MKYLVLLLAIASLQGRSDCQAVLSLDKATYIVHEGDQFTVRIRKIGTAASVVNVVVQIRDDGGDGGEDFIGMSQTAVFAPGVGADTRSVIFTVRDDNVPERDEPFRLTLHVSNGDGVVGRPAAGVVTIVANDDAFGVFGFPQLSAMVTTELSVDSPVHLVVRRYKGSHERVTVFFEISSDNDDKSDLTDLAPKTGSVVFADGELTKMLQIIVKADDIPEPDEVFKVRLTSVEGGVSVSPNSNRPKLNGSQSEAVVIISENDAPIRFALGSYRVNEGEHSSTLRLTVLRGVAGDGRTTVGSSAGVVTVKYYFVDGSAVQGDDYHGGNSSVVFTGGASRAVISVLVLADRQPEAAETFQVVLGEVTGSAVLSTPATATVTIGANDDPSGVLSLKVDGVVTVNEDTPAASVTFVVVRGGGTFGSVSVGWEITRLDDDPAGDPAADLYPTSGVVTFVGDEREKTIVIGVVPDDLPEPVERFLLRLLGETVEGGARVEGVLETTLIIEDSDDAYGLVDFSPVAPSLITEVGVRKLRLSLTRRGGRLGTLNVHFAVHYFATPTAQPSSADIFIAKMPSVVMFPAGQSELIFDVPIRDEAFLQVGGRFRVTLTEVKLVAGGDVGPFNTPKLASRLTASIEVTAEMANGEIGFTDMLPADVTEPEGGRRTTQLLLPLRREGTNGDATVYWSLAGSGPNADHISSADLTPFSGTVSMTTGQSAGVIMIDILPDDLPELDEEFTVTLTQVAPLETQRLRPGATEVKVIILENDNASGVFEFGEEMKTSYVVEEEGVAIEVSIVRTGGALVGRSLRYFVEPGGEAEFYGSTNIIRFEPGVVKQTTNILARGDGVPELVETFQLRLASYGEREARIGPRSVVNITVEQNDHPYGLFEFPPNLTVYINETLGENKTVASLPVMRTMGRFETAQVDWFVIGQEFNNDIAPLNGSLTFEPGVGTIMINIEALADNIPENDEIFTVQLTNATNGAVLGRRRTADIVIVKNDDAVYFKEPSTARLVEDDGGRVTFTIVRDGPTDGVATVMYRTVDDGATAAGGDYVAIAPTTVHFAVGEWQHSVVVTILRDDEPETDERFFLELFDAEGGIAVYGTPRATIVIEANDGANGIFSFALPLVYSLQEGKRSAIEVVREKGHYSEVQVHWTLSPGPQMAAVNVSGDFAAAKGYVTFADLQERAAIELSPLSDGVPEYEETFVLTLHKATGGGPSGEVPVLATSRLVVVVKVAENDDPFGLFAFAPSSLRVHVAEDYDEDSRDQTRASLEVDRGRGHFTDVQVCWQVFSHHITGAMTLPTIWDLLFLGSVPDAVPRVPEERRPRTGTDVLQFNGCEDCYVTVPPRYHPPPAEIKDGFSMSAWLQVGRDVDGYVLSKTSADGARQFYALKISTAISFTAGARTVTVELRYSLPKNANNLVAARVLNVNVEDSLWHFILLIVDKGQVSFFVDGSSIGTSRLAAEEIEDEEGVLLVGTALGQGRYTGLMQDVRVYARPLVDSEIRELYLTPSMNDLYPISGYVSFAEGTRREDIVIATVDDEEEEADEIFTVKILSAKGARLADEGTTATLTVLKSDNANGLFGFSGACTLESPEREDTLVHCPVERRRGDADFVTLDWVVEQRSEVGGRLSVAAADFRNATGQLVFNPGERRKMCTLSVYDDSLPEVSEHFLLTLVSATTADWANASTPTSGASVDPAARSAPFSLPPSDHPFGQLEFSSRATPPGPDEVLIPSGHDLKISVREEVNVVRLMVLRMQGMLGDVSVEFRTVDGTARSSGKSPPDFVARVGQLRFAAGERVAFINVTIIDNAEPEGEKYFGVELVNPAGGVELGAGSRVRVTVEHSDHAFGVFQFAPQSLSVTAEEGVEDTPVRLKVVREGGAIGVANVTWRVRSDPHGDLVASAGWLAFSDGQTTGDVVLRVRSDDVAELAEAFLITLTGTSEGRLGETKKLTARLTIGANDDPFGIFWISDQNRPVHVDEDETVVKITVERGGGTYGDVRLSYATLSPQDNRRHLPTGMARASDTDFRNSTGVVLFMEGIRTVTFGVQILDDLEPEIDETVFVELVDVWLIIEVLQDSDAEMSIDSPRLADPTLTYGQVIITENDNARGILQLSASFVSVAEGHLGNVVMVTRSAGRFGLVSVKVEVVAGSAQYGLDYSVSSSDVVMVTGEREKRVPVEIIDDGLPERDETFTIRLVGTPTGGAVLGAVTETRVVIEASDDPYGAFGFELPLVVAVEPEMLASFPLEVAIVRTGGSYGVVAVDWTATLNGVAPELDINPTSGTEFFVSNQARRVITLNILADDDPEGIENIVLSLTSATNDGRIDEARRTMTVAIQPNDDPHGTVEFERDEFIVHEMEDDVLQWVKVVRSGGTYGELRVTYETRPLDLLTEAERGGGTVDDYFSSPLHGKPLPLVGTPWDVSKQANPRKACASFCLLTRACRAYDFSLQRLACDWFSHTDYTQLNNLTGYVYYERRQKQVLALYSRVAQPGVDFVEVRDESIVIPDGASHALVPIGVISDDLPELNESFYVRLTNVYLSAALQGVRTLDLPTMGPRAVATVTVAANDNANGAFRLRCRDPRATHEGARISVGETEKFFLIFAVEREGGSIGAVSVQWRINEARTTATRNADFVADGATLSFTPGELEQVFTIGIEDDDLPENDEIIIVELVNPQGGAEIGQFSNVTAVIMANDNVAGVLSFSKTSYLVREGDILVLRILRSAPAIGRVTVDWTIEAINSQPPSVRFRNYNGTIFFDRGVRVAEVILHVLVDNTPKINQEYSVILRNVSTEGVRQSGAAAVAERDGAASITIEGGNNPHGVFSFSASVLERRVSEGSGRIEMAVDRKFGDIGVVRVHYSVTAGFLRPPDATFVPAVADLDFRRVAAGNVLAYDGDNSVAIPVYVIDDDVPEIDEIFTVTLTSVELVSPQNSTFLPRLAMSGTKAELTIAANDGTQGEVTFSAQTAVVNVAEENTNISLVIERGRGQFGHVSVFCFAQSSSYGAKRGEDFNFEPRDVHFAAGVTRQLVFVEILQDTLPEADETFEVVLASPKNGLVVGDPGKAVITILASDGASGVVNFDTPANVTLNEPSEASTAGSKARIQLVRAPGIFGVIRVPFRIISAVSGDDAVTDLEPVSGDVTFADKQGTAILEVFAMADDIPEEREIFHILLMQPEGGATLGPVSRKTLIIERNDAPYGRMDIYIAGSKNRSVNVEETSGSLYFEVVRSRGSLGSVTVDLVTRRGSATAHAGPHMDLSVIQQITVSKPVSWHSFVHAGSTYVVLLNEKRTGPLTTAVGSSGEAISVTPAAAETQSMLYKWQGSLVPIQTIETDGAHRAASFRIDGQQYLFICNFGAYKRYRTHSRLYRVTEEGRLVVVQDLQTRGATAAALVSLHAEHFLVVTNRHDNDVLNTNINSDVYRWSTARFGVVPVQYVPTRGAVGVLQVALADAADDEAFLLVLNHKDSVARNYEINSVLYKMSAGGRLSVHQTLGTRGVVDATAFRIGDDAYVAIADGYDNAAEYRQQVVVYVWSVERGRLEAVQHVPVTDAQRVHAFTTDDGVTHLAVAAIGSGPAIYTWDHSLAQFNVSWQGAAPTRDFYPLRVAQSAPRGALQVMLATPQSETATPPPVSVYQLTMLGDADYVPRGVTLTFDEGQHRLQTAVTVRRDSLPEDTETFFVELTNPRRGAELGALTRVAVNILSNDDGHGIIEFAQDSLYRWVEEIPGRENSVQLNVVRRKGTSGRVVVRWKASGDHNGIHDITPVDGVVEFASGQAAATISITVHDDVFAELDETSVITLVEVLEKGTTLPDRGAVIGENATARITILANDSPHGVIAWKTDSYVTTEPARASSSVTLHIVRKQGAQGHVRVTYMTTPDVRPSRQQEAVSGRDYVSTHATVDMLTDVTQVSVDVAILADDEPEVDESFLVNITAVRLIGAPVDPASGPSVRRPGNLVTVTIAENDNARGIIEFNQSRNAENRVDSHEGAGRVSLRLSRSVGHFGTAEVTWQALPREADATDFTPTAGVIVFPEQRTHAFIVIDIIDDDVPENLETFDVQLIKVTAGGATLGKDKTLRVGILKNDSPNGLFSFVAVKGKREKTVKESRSMTDPEGVVGFDVLRRGTDGEINVQWQLDIRAADDFVPPLTGRIKFMAGESRKTITLRTKPDDILEGEERFTISLIAADNNADISPTEGDAVVVIAANEGASGVITVLPETRHLTLGEPDEVHDGVGEVRLGRGVGVYGEVKVAWTVVPRDAGAFVATQGEVTFEDQQQFATIRVQTKDDSDPETRQQFTLQITSATGGATIDPSHQVALIEVVASDYPHGLFEFSQPPEVVVREAAQQVSITVIRNYGSVGSVRVFFTTSPGSATASPDAGEDFVSAAGWVSFSSRETEKRVSVTIIDDSRAERPETFYVNLTRVELLYPLTNNYTKVGGLQLDMAPAIGPLAAKVVIIDKSDHAEGTVQFAPEALQFKVREERGVASVPLTRGPGVFGQLTVTFRVVSGSAVEGRDFLSPHGEVVIADGDTTAVINVTLVDDPEMEFDEQFTLHLVGVKGGADLGARTTAIVTILKSDYPNGKFSFRGDTELIIDNPESTRTFPVYVERTHGLLGEQQVTWRLYGPNSVTRVLEETGDVAVRTPAGSEVTSGVLSWGSGQAGARALTLHLKAHAGWEVRKTFYLVLVNVQPTPSNVGAGEIGQSDGVYMITVRKFGHPNGIVRFDGVAQVTRTFDEPPGPGGVTVVFPLYRRENVLGSLQVHWKVGPVPGGPPAPAPSGGAPAPSGGATTSPDVTPSSGVAMIAGDKRRGVIELRVLPDDVPELDETFMVTLTRVEGGADVDSAYNVSTFIIKYNDYPHGRFAIHSARQSVRVLTSDLQRQVRVNITREAGSSGRVRVSFALRYDEAQPGVSYIPSSGSVTFTDGMRYAIADVDVERSVYLSLGSTFTVTLTSVQYIGVGVTMAPEIDQGHSVAKVTVPQAAANSQVGFESTIVSVDEGTRVARVTVGRLGSYGTVEVDWLVGFPSANAPLGFLRGALSPETGTLRMANGVDSQLFMVQLTAQLDRPEMFAVHLPRVPKTDVLGGARLRPDAVICRIEPYGVVQFAQRSRVVEVTEGDEPTEVTLYIERKYGSQDNIQIRYDTLDGTALGGVDFLAIQNGAITMDPRQISASIFVQIKPDDLPETAEYFFVNFTSITRLPTDLHQDSSPRISDLYGTAKVVIRRNSDPYGVVSLKAMSGSVDGKTSEPGHVQLLVSRSGGTFGRISVRVRTVGGGEAWEKLIGPAAGAGGTDTIGDALASQRAAQRPTFGADYAPLDRVLDFKEREQQQTMTLYIRDDETPEDDEVFFVYVTAMTEGVRVAMPSTDNKKGYATVTIRRNDFWGGWVGFYAANSTEVTADEDAGKAAVLTIERRNSSYGKLTVEWSASLTKDGAEVVSADLDLTSQLERVSSAVKCAEGQRFCSFSVPLIDDNVPENETSFYVRLSGVSEGGSIDPRRSHALVTLLPSDHPRGLVQFSEQSRNVYVARDARSVSLALERLGHDALDLVVTYRAQQVEPPQQVAGVRVYRAEEGADFARTAGRVHFPAGRRSQTIEIALDPTRPFSQYPKTFRVVLDSVTNSAQLGVRIGQVTLVDHDDLDIWNVWSNPQAQMDNSTIDQLMRKLQRATESRSLTMSQLSITQGVLEEVIKVAETRPLLQGTQGSVMAVFCHLLKPTRDKNDATRGRWRLSKLLERFAFSFVAQRSCDKCCTSEDNLLMSPECPYVQFGVAKWYPDYINNYNYRGKENDFFTMPANLLAVQDNGIDSKFAKCFPVVFVQYFSEQWFTEGPVNRLLSSRLFSAVVKDHPARFLTQPMVYRIHTPNVHLIARRAECVYFDEDDEEWTAGLDVCSIVNNLALAVDNYVECACTHMSHYAVRTKVKRPDLIGYPIWFQVSCFVCMFCLAVVIVAHHVCTFHAMFSAGLLMHMCFAVLVSELCYVIDAYLSPDHLLSLPPEAGNYRCIVMGLALHYFFLAQFTWMMTQAVNFWKILLLNDEHTQRKYVLYFLIGWGLPALIVAAFYTSTFVIYRYMSTLPQNQIYGDLNGNADICFVTSPYAGLAGVIAPAVLCLLVVGVVFTQAFQMTAQWQAYDDVYRGRYNLHEVRTMLLFWACIVMTWLWGGLHMVYGQLWMLVLFAIFNLSTGVYAVVVYVILRNPCCPCLRPQKAVYSINAGLSDAGGPPYRGPLDTKPTSVKGSRASLIHEPWDDPGGAVAPLKGGDQKLHVKRAPTNVYMLPPTSYECKTPTSQVSDDPGESGRDFDDLISALRGGAGAGGGGSGAPQPAEATRPPGGATDRRKIAIADTHL